MPHPVAVSGFASDPWRPERGRPGYPTEAVRFLIERIQPDSTDLVIRQRL